MWALVEFPSNFRWTSVELSSNFRRTFVELPSRLRPTFVKHHEQMTNIGRTLDIKSTKMPKTTQTVWVPRAHLAHMGPMARCLQKKARWPFFNLACPMGVPSGGPMGFSNLPPSGHLASMGLEQTFLHASILPFNPWKMHNKSMKSMKNALKEPFEN